MMKRILAWFLPVQRDESTAANIISNNLNSLNAPILFAAMKKGHKK